MMDDDSYSIQKSLYLKVLYIRCKYCMKLEILGMGKRSMARAKRIF